MAFITIGQLARSAKVNKETIKYYEKQALIPKPSKSESGYRQYSDLDTQRIIFIKRAQKLGFTLREIKDLLELRGSETSTCDQVKKKITQKVALLKSKVAEMNIMIDALNRMSCLCKDEEALVAACPIINILSDMENHYES